MDISSVDSRIKRIYPDFDVKTIDVIDDGQNNQVFLINGDYIFRFPRKEVNRVELAKELKVLFYLKDDLSISIPNITYYNMEDKFEKCFMAYPCLKGEVMRREVFDGIKHQDGLAKQLAIFLKELHKTEVDDDLRKHLVASDPILIWQDLHKRFRKHLYKHMRPDSIVDMDKRFDTIFETLENESFAPTLIHGDFGPSNILVDRKSDSITGIIDFGSVSIGDPANDIASLIGPFGYGLSFAYEMAESYGDLKHYIKRAQAYTSTFALQEALYGVENNDSRAFEAGIKAYR